METKNRVACFKDSYRVHLDVIKKPQPWLPLMHM